VILTVLGGQTYITLKLSTCELGEVTDSIVLINKLSPAHPPSIPTASKAKMYSEEKPSDQNSHTPQCFYLSVDIITNVQNSREVNLTCSRPQHMATNNPDLLAPRPVLKP